MSGARQNASGDSTHNGGPVKILSPCGDSGVTGRSPRAACCRKAFCCTENSAPIRSDASAARHLALATMLIPEDK